MIVQRSEMQKDLCTVLVYYVSKRLAYMKP